MTRLLILGSLPVRRRIARLTAILRLSSESLLAFTQ